MGDQRTNYPKSTRGFATIKKSNCSGVVKESADFDSCACFERTTIKIDLSSSIGLSSFKKDVVYADRQHKPHLFEYFL